MKFLGNVSHGTRNRWLKFGDVPDDVWIEECFEGFVIVVREGLFQFYAYDQRHKAQGLWSATKANPQMQDEHYGGRHTHWKCPTNWTIYFRVHIPWRRYVLSEYNCI